jgi:hypothetical protein
LNDNGSPTSQEDVKAKMRAALDRKNDREKASHGDGGHGEGKAHDVAAPDLKRTFRRKSG